MVDENTRQELTLINIEEKTNYFLQEIKKNEWMSRKHRNVCITHFNLFYFLQLLDLFEFMLSLFCLVFLLELRVLQQDWKFVQ